VTAISFNVTDTAGHPIRDATVELKDANAGPFFIPFSFNPNKKLTDTAGHAEFDTTQAFILAGSPIRCRATITKGVKFKALDVVSDNFGQGTFAVTLPIDPVGQIGEGLGDAAQWIIQNIIFVILAVVGFAVGLYVIDRYSGGILGLISRGIRALQKKVVKSITVRRR
jgi:hypothetical protein